MALRNRDHKRQRAFPLPPRAVRSVDGGSSRALSVPRSSTPWAAKIFYPCRNVGPAADRAGDDVGRNRGISRAVAAIAESAIQQRGMWGTPLERRHQTIRLRDRHWNPASIASLRRRRPGPYERKAAISRHFERDPIPYALETDWPVGAAGFERLHLRIEFAKTLSSGREHAHLE
jgi:hypothetical protein